MPGPAPHAIWVETMLGGSLVTFENYFGQRQSLHREQRSKALSNRLSKNTWQCRWCSSSLPSWKRVDAYYCRESCRKKAARKRKQRSYVLISQ